MLWATGYFERDLDFLLATMEKSASMAALPRPEPHPDELPGGGESDDLTFVVEH